MDNENIEIETDIGKVQNIVSGDTSKNQKNRVGVLVGLIFCIILVVCSIVLEMVVIRDEVLRTMGKVSGWDGSGFVVLFEIVPMLVIASIISRFCGKKAVGTAKTILNYLRPVVILVGGLVVMPIIGIIIIPLLAGK